MSEYFLILTMNSIRFNKLETSPTYFCYAHQFLLNSTLKGVEIIGCPSPGGARGLGQDAGSELKDGVYSCWSRHSGAAVRLSAARCAQVALLELGVSPLKLSPANLITARITSIGAWCFSIETVTCKPNKST